MDTFFIGARIARLEMICVSILIFDEIPYDVDLYCEIYYSFFSKYFTPEKHIFIELNFFFSKSRHLLFPWMMYEYSENIYRCGINATVASTLKAYRYFGKI